MTQDELCDVIAPGAITSQNLSCDLASAARNATLAQSCADLLSIKRHGTQSDGGGREEEEESKSEDAIASLGGEREREAVSAGARCCVGPAKGLLRRVTENVSSESLVL
eukprot:9089872-Pyramimonas_sp.AAC.1